MKAVDWPVSRGHLWPFWWFLIPEPYIILITSAIVQDHPTPKDRPFSYWDLSFYLFLLHGLLIYSVHTYIYIYISKIYIHCIIIYIYVHIHIVNCFLIHRVQTNAHNAPTACDPTRHLCAGQPAPRVPEQLRGNVGADLARSGTGRYGPVRPAMGSQLVLISIIIIYNI